MNEVTNTVIPVISAVGNGPRGKGVYPQTIEDKPGTYVIAVYDDDTNEEILRSKNLSAGEISFDIPKFVGDPEPGKSYSIFIQKIKDGIITREEIKIPAGARGLKGDTGKDAFQYAVEQGFSGDAKDWIDSLKEPAETAAKEAIKAINEANNIPTSIKAYVDSKFVVVDEMPASPVDGLLYFVRE